MLFKVQTENGTIIVFKEAVNCIIVKVIEEFEGKVSIGNHKGKLSDFMSKIGGKEEASDIQITNGEHGLDIRVYLLIRFGTSIRKVTELLIDRIKTQVEMETEQSVNSVSLIITGVFSKQIAKRNIEIKREVRGC